MRAAFFGRMVRIGNSKGIVIPPEIQIMIGAKKGDILRIEAEVVLSESDLHDNDAAPQP